MAPTPRGASAGRSPFPPPKKGRGFFGRPTNQHCRGAPPSPPHPPPAFFPRGGSPAAPEDLAARVAPYASALVLWFVNQVGNIGMLLVQFLLTVIIAAILYANGESAAQEVDRIARRLAGAQGENAVHLAAHAIRGVA